MPAPRILRFYFSPRGRISRSQYWLGYIVPVLVIEIALAVAAGIAQANENHGIAGLFTVLYSLFAFLAIWPSFATLTKRIHDRDKPGWLVLLPVLTWLLMIAAVFFGVAAESPSAAGIFAGIVAVVSLVIGIWFLIEFGLMRGTIGPNRYGPDPVAPARP